MKLPTDRAVPLLRSSTAGAARTVARAFPGRQSGAVRRGGRSRPPSLPEQQEAAVHADPWGRMLGGRIFAV